MDNIGLTRSRSLIWNTIPAWNGSRVFKGLDVKEGIHLFEELLPLLPKAKTLILVGNQAQKAEKFLKSASLNIHKSAHPSPLVKARSRALWEQIPIKWAEAITSRNTMNAGTII